MYGIGSLVQHNYPLMTKEQQQDMQFHLKLDSHNKPIGAPDKSPIPETLCQALQHYQRQAR
jgi:hypothetical protein